MSSRALIACLLPALLLASGCDRKSTAPGQGNAAAPSAAAEAGKLDRSHAGEALPKAAIQTVYGQPISLSDYAGKPLLVNLWATWCAPCVKELPTLDATSKANAGRLQVMLVSEDSDPKAVLPFLDAHGISLRSAADPRMALGTTLGTNLPTTILYGSDGKEVWRYTGGFDWSSAEAAKLLAEAR